MLSFLKGKPIAKVVGGHYKGKILRITEEGKNEKKAQKFKIKPRDIFDLFSEEELKTLKKNMTKTEMKQLSKALIQEIRPDDEDIEDAYDDAMEKITKKVTTELKLSDGYLAPIPNINRTEKQRDCVYVAGPSGSGKSTWIRMYGEMFKKLYPDRPIFIFSRLKKDPVLDELDPKRILIDDKLVDKPIEIKELEKSLCIFDDIDTISDKKQKAVIQQLRDDILETGRHEEIYMCNTSHQLMNYKGTRTLLNESTAVVVFPKSGSAYHIRRYFKVYGGLTTKQTDRIMGLPSRWVMHSKTFPQYILYEAGCYLLND